MKKYRIIEETKSKTGKVKYYIEKYRSFFWLKYWSRLTMYVPVYDIELTMDYNSLEEAINELNRITESTKTKVIKTVNCL